MTNRVDEVIISTIIFFECEWAGHTEMMDNVHGSLRPILLETINRYESSSEWLPARLSISREHTGTCKTTATSLAAASIKSSPK